LLNPEQGLGHPRSGMGNLPMSLTVYTKLHHFSSDPNVLSAVLAQQREFAARRYYGSAKPLPATHAEQLAAIEAMCAAISDADACAAIQGPMSLFERTVDRTLSVALRERYPDASDAELEARLEAEQDYRFYVAGLENEVDRVAALLAEHESVGARYAPSVPLCGHHPVDWLLGISRHCFRSGVPQTFLVEVAPYRRPGDPQLTYLLAVQCRTRNDTVLARMLVD
jgi:hypothetical protein